ncbi:MAG: response regulator transcription factor [Bacteroidetes bacterium]|nr:response regulator transcription factor [Bacteroidota bacterium]
MLNILIADDHPMFRVGLLRVLKYLDESYIVHQVSNGVEVLDFLKDNPCDLIIMDINMPIMNGIKTTESRASRIS